MDCFTAVRRIKNCNTGAVMKMVTVARLFQNFSAKVGGKFKQKIQPPTKYCVKATFQTLYSLRKSNPIKTIIFIRFFF
jgi:hypothetical protein